MLVVDRRQLKIGFVGRVPMVFYLTRSASYHEEARVSASKIPDRFRQFGELMHLAEVDMARVYRWGPFRNVEPGVSDQSSGLHSYSLALVTSEVVQDLQPHVRLDEARLLRAVLVHDLSEGILGRDVDRRRKTSEMDAAECRAFFRFADGVSNGSFRKNQEDFLLQFCLTHGNDQHFTPEDHEIMAWLRMHCHHEAVAFRVLEEFEYQLYAVRQYIDRGNPAVLRSVVRNNLERFEAWAGQLPGFNETYEIAAYGAWCRAEVQKFGDKDV